MNHKLSFMKTMRTSSSLNLRSSCGVAIPLLSLFFVSVTQIKSDPAILLFEDNFTGGIPGWTAVQPAGAYIEPPMIWQFDKVTDSFSEQSNIYTDSSTASTSRRAVMLISDAVAPTNFTYTARLTAGDDDGFGLIWGFEDDASFYRVTFARQNRFAVGWPFQGVIVDRMSNSIVSDIHGPDNAFINTANRPFDVTLSVTNGLLTLAIVDDPLGTAGGPFPYNPVTDLALPSVVNARVGIFSWGQSGGTPRSFRIQSPVLNGTALDAAAVSQVLSNWSFTVTPSATNDYPVNTGLWSQALLVGGDKGAMIENNDSAPENLVTSSTNTPVFASVAGDVNWSNYVYSVRLISGDDDGFGIFLRYQDRTNWYRIGFRAQNSQAGIKQGISVQKNVNRTFDQMLSSTAFIPPINAPFDVHAAIRDNLLQIMCVQNPDSTSPTITSFGPIDMGASTLVPSNLTTGKIGVFSWAQYGVGGLEDFGTATDWVRVRQVNGEGLLVSSPFGTPDPPVGLNDLPVSGSVTARVDSAVVTAPGIRQISMGWAGAGSVPASGATNEATFTLTQFSLITWKWQTQYLLTVNANAGGSAVPSIGPWINPGSNVTVTATANAGYVFTHWSGDSIFSSPAATFSMVRPVTLTANFAVDSDTDGLPDSWEQQYFGGLGENAAGDPDSDSANNLAEYQSGTNPKSAENLVFTDGIQSKWINDARDRALPGWFMVTNFGSGFRGLWEASNQNRAANSAGPDDAPFISATSYATNASFQGPFIVVRTNNWNPAWENTFSLSAEYSVGDNDGLCLYFRYLNPSNWYRVTICGDDTAAPTRPLQYLSIQKRTNGWFTAMTPSSQSGLDIYNDELDLNSFKRIRITVNATNDTFEVRAIGWNALIAIPDWDPSFEKVITFTDTDVPGGRIGIGPWGMGGGKVAWSATNGNPVGSGLFIDNIVLQVAGTNAFVEDWETATLHTDLPAGWENPYAGVLGYAGDWHVSGHGTLAGFTAAFGTPQTGTTEFPKADGEGPILLAPALTNANYLLELGIHPLDDGGMGFVYDFKDTNNFARVLFNSQVPLAGQFAQGLNVGRKSAGIWSDIVVGDNTFVYTPGRPFDVRFANNNGAYTLTAWNLHDPATVYHWQWTGQEVAATNRLGLALWDMPNAHYTHVRAYSLPEVAPVVPFKINNISLVGGNVVLDVSKPGGSSYHVLRATSVTGPYTTNAANQTGAQYSEPLPAGTAHYYRLQLLP
jgi:uncharacterized repeat protein (TIGR02543 family)